MGGLEKLRIRLSLAQFQLKLAVGAELGSYKYGFWSSVSYFNCRFTSGSSGLIVSILFSCLLLQLSHVGRILFIFVLHKYELCNFSTRAIKGFELKRVKGF